MKRNIIKKKHGQAAVFITVALIGIVSLLALLVDTGRIFVEHTKLERGVDAAVLAAAQDLPIGKNVNGSASTEDSVEQVIMTALSYNLNNDASSYIKDKNMNRYLLPTSNNYGTATVTKEQFHIEDGDADSTVDIQFVTPANSSNGKKTVVSVTVSKKIKTRMAMILGYNEWTISTQRIAMIGPIQSVPSILPFGILVDTDTNGHPETLPLFKTVRLSNTNHDSNVNNQYQYVLLHASGETIRHDSSGNKPNFAGITTTDTPTVAQIVSNSNRRSSSSHNIGTTNGRGAVDLRIATKSQSESAFLGVCAGLNERIAESAFENSVGCINTDEAVDANINYNFAFGDSSAAYGYFSDPRMFVLPVVQYTTNYSDANKNLGNRLQREYKIIGFTLFFYQYGHYTSHPATDEYYIVQDSFLESHKEPPAMTEMVGYFTSAIFEGPVNPAAPDYGIYGIQYVSPDDENIFSITY